MFVDSPHFGVVLEPELSPLLHGTVLLVDVQSHDQSVCGDRPRGDHHHRLLDHADLVCDTLDPLLSLKQEPGLVLDVPYPYRTRLAC